MIIVFLLIAVLLAGCAEVNLDAPVPVYETGLDSSSWVEIPAGAFLMGQFDTEEEINYDYQMMITDVTVAQYVEFLNVAVADGALRVVDNAVVTEYHGDPFSNAKHEIRIDAGDYLVVPVDDPASPFKYDGTIFSVKEGWEDHPMTNVSWFGAWKYCGYYGWKLPTEMEWEKAARGPEDNRAYPWGEGIFMNNANFYKSGDPFEEMATVGSRTSPVGFYNGKTYNGYTTLDSASPYGLYDMAGNVWQWMGDITPGMSDRLMHGGSKATYDMDLRVWVTNSAPPAYYNVDVGFRCAKTGE